MADEIVSAAFPELVRVIFCEELLPTLTLPKLTLVGLMPNPDCVWVCDCVPIPLNATVIGEPDTSLAIEMLPLAPPAEDGLKLRREAHALARAEPSWAWIIRRMAKPVPETLAEEIVMLVVPEFVRVIGCDPLAALLPHSQNSTLVGLACGVASCASGSGFSCWRGDAPRIGAARRCWSKSLHQCRSRTCANCLWKRESAEADNRCDYRERGSESAKASDIEPLT